MPATTRSRARRTHLAAVGAAALVITTLVACGSDDDSTHAVSVPSFTSGSDATQDASVGTGTLGASTGAVVEEAVDDEEESASGSGDARDVVGVGTCIGGEDIVVNLDEAQPIISGDCGTVTVNGHDVGGAIDNAAEIIINGDSATLTGKDWGALTVNGNDASMTATSIGAATVNGDDSRVQNFGLGSLSITGDNNTVVGGPDSGAPVSDTGSGSTVI